jgi:hypothetical protein
MRQILGIQRSACRPGALALKSQAAGFTGKRKPLRFAWPPFPSGKRNLVQSGAVRRSRQKRSRPSGVQTGLVVYLFRKVRRLGALMGLRSSESSKRNRSPIPSRTMRANATARPSGETAGEQSLQNSPGGRVVSLRFSPLSTESRNKTGSRSAASRSPTMSHLPPGCHVSQGNSQGVQ